MRSANSGTPIGNALVYECVRTATTIHPNPSLLTASANMIAHFLQQTNNNLKYVALDALGHIVQIDASYGAEHQMSVIDCLEDPDETLKKKTLELLYRMTKTDNVEVVVDKMLAFLETTSDEHIKADVATRIAELAERYAPDNQWFIETMTLVFELAGDLMRPDLAHDLMQLIAEGAGEGTAADSALRKSAVSSYVDLVKTKSKLPRVLLELVAWVLGEYGTLTMGHAEVMGVLVGLAKRQDVANHPQAKAYVLTALAKVCCHPGYQGPPTDEVDALISQLMLSRACDLQQRACEIRALLSCGKDIQMEALPFDGSCEEVDVTGALEAHVAAALAAGATPYIGAELREETPTGGGGGGGGGGGRGPRASVRGIRSRANAGLGLCDPHGPRVWGDGGDGRRGRHPAARGVDRCVRRSPGRRRRRGGGARRIVVCAG